MDQPADSPTEAADQDRPSLVDEIHEIEAEYHASLEEASDGEPPLLPHREPMRSFFRILGIVEQIVGSLLLSLILILVLAQVAYRYIPGTAAWTGELARLSLVWATFLMAGYLIANPPHHIAIKVIDYVVEGRWLTLIKLFANLVILGTCVVLVYGSYTLVTTSVDQVTPAGGLSLRFVNAIPMIGLALVAVRVVLAIVIRDVPALRDGTEETA
jgi:TRAP-type C4-dicarboxylate transport system permease small subunit